MKRKLHLVLIAFIACISLVKGEVLTSENFDGSISWQTEIIDSTTNWEFVTAGLYPGCDAITAPGLGHFDAYNAPTGSSALLISPEFDLSDCRAEITFWLYRPWNTSGPKIEVYISTDDTTGTNSTLLGTAYYHCKEDPATEKSFVWYKYSFITPDSYNSTTNHLILKAINVKAGNGSLNIDDISVNAIPKKDASLTAITQPTNGSKKGLYDVAVTLNNLGTNPLTACDIKYDINGTTGIYSWTGDLSFNTSEEVIIYNEFDFPGGYSSIEVSSNLTGDEDLSNDTVKVTLAFPPLTLPYTQSFDSESDFSSFQTKIFNGSYNWEFSVLESHSSEGAVLFDCWNAYANDGALLISPALDLSSQTGKLSFWMYKYDSYGYDDKVEVYISSDDTTSVNSELLGTIYRDIEDEPVVSSDGWYQYNYTLPTSFNTDENFIIFKAISAYGNKIYIDDISVTPTQIISYLTNGYGTITARIDTTTVNSGTYVDNGSEVIFTATPDEHYQIKKWVVNGKTLESYTERTYTVSDINESTDVYVEFEAITYPVSFAVTGSNGTLAATVSDTSITSGDLIIEGSEVIFTATPNEHYKVKQWVVNGVTIADYTDSTYTVSEVEESTDVYVEFETITYPVSFAVTGSDGTITATVSDTSITSGDYIVDGSSVKFIATPNDHYKVKSWTVNDTIVKDYSETNYTIESLSDTIIVTVEFEIITYPVSFATTGSEGTLTASVSDTSISSGDYIVDGSSVKFTASPAALYQVKNWIVNDVIVKDYTDTSYTIESLSETINLTIEFEEITHQVTFSVAEGTGTLSAKVNDVAINSGDYITGGSTVEFTATPADEYTISAWLVNDNVVNDNTSTTYTISSISEDNDIKVKFEHSSSITQITNNELSFYPNPATEGFYIEIDNDAQSLLNIYAFDGKLVLSQFVKNNDYIDVTSFKQGIYLLKLDNYSGKLIIKD